MKHILVIADPMGAEQLAIDKALSFAKSSDSKMHVVSFCYESMGDYEVQDNDYDYANVKVELVRHCEEWLSDYIKQKAGDIEVTHEVVWEKHIHRWIMSHCEICPYDLMVKTGHRSESVFYTPTDWQLFRQSSVPVYIVSDMHIKNNKTVLVAIDMMAKSDEKLALNRKLLEQGFRLAVQLGGDLHACHAIHIATLIRDLELIDVSAHEHAIEKQVLERTDSLLQEYDIGRENFHVKQGDPDKVVNDIARKLHVQCIVIGSMGRTGIAAKFIGNTAEKVIHRSHSDLLVVSPDEED